MTRSMAHALATSRRAKKFASEADKAIIAACAESRRDHATEADRERYGRAMGEAMAAARTAAAAARHAEEAMHDVFERASR